MVSVEVKKDIKIVATEPEKAKKFKKYWQENNLEFYGISDKDHSVLKLYGQEVKIFRMKRMPVQMLVDKQGILRHVYHGHSMKDIPENKEIFELIDEL